MHFVTTNAWTERARAAYFRRVEERGTNWDQPSAGADTIFDERTGRHFVVLTHGNDISAVYRVADDDRLRWLDAENWPEALRQLYS